MLVSQCTKEWLGQHTAGVNDFSVIGEYDDVVAKAKKSGKEVHMARIHGICVEKVQGTRSATVESSEEPVLGGRILSGSR